MALKKMKNEFTWRKAMWKTKVYFKWVKDLNMKVKMIKQIKENVREYLCDWGAKNTYIETYIYICIYFCICMCT